jgi:hypothetical protein
MKLIRRFRFLQLKKQGMAIRLQPSTPITPIGLTLVPGHFPS